VLVHRHGRRDLDGLERFVVEIRLSLAGRRRSLAFCRRTPPAARHENDSSKGYSSTATSLARPGPWRIDLAVRKPSTAEVGVREVRARVMPAFTRERRGRVMKSGSTQRSWVVRERRDDSRAVGPRCSYACGSFRRSSIGAHADVVHDAPPTARIGPQMWIWVRQARH